MRKLTAIFAGAILLMSSCTMTKRYHNSGFQVNWNFGKEKGKTESEAKKSENQRVSKQQVQKQEVVASRKIESQPFTYSPNEMALPLLNVNESKTDRTIGSSFTLHSNKINAENPEKAFDKKAVKTMAKKMRKAASAEKNSSDGTIEMILIFICCLIIPPLGYYLKKRTTDTWFWVCLICALLSFSWFFGFGFGILGFLSVVIALLAFFDVI